MGLIIYKPTTPSYRKTVKIDKSQLFKGRPEKSLIEDLQPNSGRNNTGKITIRHRSGGHKKKYRLVNFKRNTFDKIGTVERIEYDPNRSAFIALINYQDIKEYIIAPTDLKIGDKIISSAKTEISSGNAMKIKNIPTGMRLSATKQSKRCMTTLQIRHVRQKSRGGRRREKMLIHWEQRWVIQLTLSIMLLMETFHFMLTGLVKV